MKKIFNVTLLVLLINSTVAADLSVNFNNQGVGIASGGLTPADAVAQGSLMQLIWHATGSTLASENAFNDQIGIGKSLSGEFILDELATINTFGFYGPNTGAYSSADVGGADINSGVFFLRAFDSETGSVGGWVRDFAAVDASAWVYNAVDTGTIYQGNLTGGSPGSFVDIQNSANSFVIQEAGLTTTNYLELDNLNIINIPNPTNTPAAGYSTNFLSGDVILTLNNVTNIVGSDGIDISSDDFGSTASAAGFDAIDVRGAIGINVNTVVTNILGGNGATAEVTKATSGANASGGNGIVLNFDSPSRIFETSAVIISGGDGGVAKGQDSSTIIANGGNAVKGTVGTYIIDGVFTGGDAGSTQLSGVNIFSKSADIEIEAAGGHAVQLDLNQSSIMPILSADTEFSGGDGGQFNYVGVTTAEQITNTVVTLNGGDGIHLLGSTTYKTNQTITIGEARFSGGNGGLTGIAVGDGSADGGHGLYIGSGHNLVISNGVFIGGNGGSIATTSLGSGSAQGGSGAYIKGVGVEANLAQIIGGTYSGGNGGTVDGISEQDGYALVLEDSKVELEAGVNLLDDLLVKSDSISSTTIIQAGNFSDVYFSGSSVNRSDFEIQGGELGSLYLNDAAGYNGVITGGTFDDIVISGVGDQYLQITGGNLQNVIATGNGSHDLRFGGTASIVDIIFNNSGLNNLWLSNSIGLTTSGKLTVNEGELNVNSWTLDHIQTISIDDAKVNFNNSNFQSANQSSIELIHKNAHLNFNYDQAVISGGTELNINSGTLSASNLVFESGSVVNISMSDKAGSVEPHVGFVDASETIDFKAGMQINIVNEGYTQLSELQASDSPSFSIANAKVITSSLELEDVQLEGVESSWLSGYQVGIYDNMSDDTRDLLITFGFRNLKDEINAAGDVAKLADAFQVLIENESKIHDLFAYTLSPESTPEVLTEGFLRKPEVANSLIGLQSVFRDQLAGRTRAQLKENRFGVSMPQGPRGPHGSWWDRSMERINESLPKMDLRFERRDVQQGYYKRFLSWLNGKMPSFNPRSPILSSDYRSWGKAFYSDLTQDPVEGYAGYDAQVIGGIAGLDRKLHHGVFGLAGGYADTSILGNSGQNADVDSLTGIIYYTAATRRAYLDTSISYALNLVETLGSPLAGGFTSDYTASNLSFALGAGVGFATFNDNLQITPEFMFHYTIHDQEAYKETSTIAGMPEKNFDAYDDWSSKVELGATFSMLKILENTSMNLAIQPELRLHWLHEMNPNLSDQSYNFNGSQFSASLQGRQENLLRAGLGIRFWDWTDHRTEFSLDIDTITDSEYEEFTVSGSFIHRF